MRYLGRMRYLNFHTFGPAKPPQTIIGQEIDSKAYATGPVLSEQQLKCSAQFIYRARQRSRRRL